MSKKDWRLLKAYQETGLTPEQIKDMLRRKQDETKAGTEPSAEPEKPPQG